MSVKIGTTIIADETVNAVVGHMHEKAQNGGFTSFEIESFAQSIGVPDRIKSHSCFRSDSIPAHRLADRMIQKLRKAGSIRLSGDYRNRSPVWVVA